MNMENIETFLVRVDLHALNGRYVFYVNGTPCIFILLAVFQLPMTFPHGHHHKYSQTF